MDKVPLSTSFILRVGTGDKAAHIKLQNLKTGEVVEFSKWEDLTGYLKTTVKRKGLR